MLEEIDLEELEAQPQDLRRALRRADTYRGVAREIGWAAFNLAVWPIGLADEAIRTGVRRIPPWRPKAVTEPTGVAAETPIILIHGYFHNRSGLMVMSRALRRQGFKSVHAFNYNPLRRDIPEMAESVGRRVEQVLQETGAKKVHLVGHSLGGLLARWFVEQMGGHSKVHSVVTLGTPHNGTLLAHAGRSPASRQMRPGSDLLKTLGSKPLPKSVRYLSYYSNLDVLIKPSRSACLKSGNCDNVRNILVHDMGHLSLLISPELIESIAGNLSE